MFSFSFHNNGLLLIDQHKEEKDKKSEQAILASNGTAEASRRLSAISMGNMETEDTSVISLFNASKQLIHVTLFVNLLIVTSFLSFKTFYSSFRVLRNSKTRHSACINGCRYQQ